MRSPALPERSRAAPPHFFVFYATVVVVQGVHVVEHIIQLIQVYVFDVPDDDALAVLGYLFAIQDTEEWLHLAFNITYVVSLYVLVFSLRELVLRRAVPDWTFWVFVVGGVALETWHLVEHFVIMSHVIRNGGCPCPGIGDRALSVSDTQLHFVYNAVAYAATCTPFVSIVAARRREQLSMRTGIRASPGTGHAAGRPRPDGGWPPDGCARRERRTDRRRRGPPTPRPARPAWPRRDRPRP